MPANTILETEEELRRIRESMRWQIDEPEQVIANRPKRTSRSACYEEAFRPQLRTALATLTICDDGQATGELVRLRRDQFTIGRTEGDIQLPNDDQVSARHLSFNMLSVGGVKKWVIADLQSRNGLFVRIGKASLKDQGEILIGSGRYRLNVASPTLGNASSYSSQSVSMNAPMTRIVGAPASMETDVLSEIHLSGIGARYFLHEKHYWIGRDENCFIRRTGDHMTKGQHALLSRSSNGTWIVQNNRSRNGVWLRMPSVMIELGSSCEFQIGEQRFRFQFGMEAD